MERVTTLGWADEFSKMDFPDRLGDDPFIRKICQKDITSRGNFLSVCAMLYFSHKPL